MAVTTTPQQPHPHSQGSHHADETPMVRHGIWTCTAVHQRLHTRAHQFTNRLFWFGMDVDRLDSVPNAPGMFSTTSPAWVQFCDADFFPTSSSGTVSSRVLQWIAEQPNHPEMDPEQCRVLLLGQLRTVGYVFNPIAMYVVTNQTGQPLCAVAEVTNTFYERKAYLLPLTHWQPDAQEARFWARLPKHFYVSPFLDLDLTFDFTFVYSPNRFTLMVNSLDAEGVVHIHTQLSGCYQPLTLSSLFKSLAQYPAMPQCMIAAIHWQAFRLWCKRIPHRQKHHNPQWQTYRIVSRFP